MAKLKVIMSMKDKIRLAWARHPNIWQKLKEIMGIGYRFRLKE